MFSFFKKKPRIKVDLSGLKADMHSHLLPGIDDGSPDTEVSVQLISGLSELGYEKLITTPHILSDMFRNDRNTIAGARKELDPSLKASGLSVQLETAAEYYMDEHFDDLLEKNIPLLTIKENWVLVEFSFVSPPLNLKEKLFDLQIRGYQPVVAHPERYTYFAAGRQVFDELKGSGCYLQVNLLSLTGYYGKISLELAQYLIKNQLVDLLGTDLHHFRHLEALRSSSLLTDLVKELLDSGRILNPQL